MSWSFPIARLFGSEIRIHVTFFLLLAWIAIAHYQQGGPPAAVEGVAFILALFGCVVAHEFGHALAARRYGIKTPDITLLPIGGLARLERMPEKSGQEIVVALAGPAVNVVIALGLLLGMVASGMALPWEETRDVADLFVGRVLVANVVLCLFNLLPAFPMDGGRVLRALLSIRMTRLRATEVAVKVGTVVAALMLVAGFVSVNFGLIAVAVVVWMLGQAELAGVRMMSMAREFEERARELFGGAPDPAGTPLPIDTATDLAARRFSGLAWDADRRVWVQWLNGVPVRDVPT
jgi:Zn-dependent protease